MKSGEPTLTGGRPYERPISTLPGDVAFRNYVNSMKTKRYMTQQELADRIGVSRNTITEWKRNAGSMPVWGLRALIREFGMSSTEILQILEVEE